MDTPKWGQALIFIDQNNVEKKISDTIIMFIYTPKIPISSVDSTMHKHIHTHNNY